MARVAPYGVITPQATGLVIASSPERALEGHVRRRHGASTKVAVEQARPTAKIFPLHAWRLVFETGTRAYFSSNEDAVRARAAMEGAVSHESADALDALMDLSDAELLEQVRFVWTQKEIDARLPGVWGRINNPKKYKTAKMSQAIRRLVVYGLRLAMDHPFFGTQERDPGNAALQRQIDAHIGSVPQETILSIWSHNPSPALRLADRHLLHALIRFAEAYGEDATRLTPYQVAELWEGGPGALELARIDERIGKGNDLASWLNRTQAPSTKSTKFSAGRPTRL